MNRIKRFWWVGLLLLFSLPVLADTVDYQTISDAAQKTNDLSRQALVMIFGEVVINPFAPSRPTLIGSLFAIINGFLERAGSVLVFDHHVENHREVRA